MRTVLLSCSMMLLAGMAGQSRADDYDSPGMRDTVDQQLAPYGLPGWYSIRPARLGELILPPHPQGPRLIDQTERLLDKIIIPSFAIRDVPIVQALTILEAELARGDAADAAAAGVKIEPGKARVKLRTDVVGKESGYNPTVTLQLKGATARQVLTSLAYSLGLSVACSEDSVWLAVQPKVTR